MAKKKSIKVVHRKLGKEQAYGLASPEEKLVEIDERLTGKKYLEIFIHEVTHVQNPRWSETKVTHNSKELASLLWEHGFRWVDLKK